jgi:hypothetical protein
VRIGQPFVDRRQGNPLPAIERHDDDGPFEARVSISGDTVVVEMTPVEPPDDWTLLLAVSIRLSAIAG